MATTINAANIGIGFDAKKLKAGIDLTRGELAKLKSLVTSTRDPIKAYERDEQLLALAHQKGAINASQLQRSMEALREKYGVIRTAQGVVLRQTEQEATSKARATAASNNHTAALARENAALMEQYQRQSKVSSATMAAVNAKQGGFGGGSGLIGTAASMGGAGPLTGLIGMGAKAGAVGGLAMLAKSGLEAAASAEKATVQFGVMFGGVEKGKQLMLEMRQLSTLGINLSALQQSATTMGAFGISVDNVIPTLKMLGDVTAGDTMRLQMMSLAFSQMTAAGRLQGQDLLQMVNAGFNPLQEISRTTGKTLIELRKDMENGAISADMVTKAFQSATSEGGRFHGMLESQKNTLSGQWAGAVSAGQTFLIEFGDALKLLAMPVITLTTTMLQGFTGIIGIVKAAKQEITDIIFVFDALERKQQATADLARQQNDEWRRMASALRAEREAIEANADAAKRVFATTTEHLAQQELLRMATENYAQLINQVGKDEAERLKEIAEYKERGRFAMHEELAIIQKQILALRNPELQRWLEAQEQGMNQEQFAQLEEARERLKVEQEIAERKKEAEQLRKKTAEETAKKQKDEAEKAQKDAREIAERFDPGLKLANAVMEVQKLIEMGALTAQAGRQEQLRLIAEQEKQSQPGKTAASTVSADSREVFKYITGQRDKALVEAERQTKLQNILVETSAQQLQVMRSQPTLGVARS